MSKNQVIVNTEFISVKEASNLYHCSSREIRYWCQKYRRYKLAFKHGNKWYLNKNEFIKHKDL